MTTKFLIRWEHAKRLSHMKRAHLLTSLENVTKFKQKGIYNKVISALIVAKKVEMYNPGIK